MVKRVAKRISSKTRASIQRAAEKPSRAGEPLRIALVGIGTVGSSVAKILCQSGDGPLRLTHIFDRNAAKRHESWVPKSVRWVETFDEVLASDADVVVELIGGLDPAREWIRKALRAGKSVVTANKMVIAESGAELQEMARQMGRRIEFGASVAGGIPVIIGIQEGLAGDRLYEIAGILNGTCNYVLTRMEASGAGFHEALKEAQKLGFAEADPSADVEGFDARAKLVILTRAGLRTEVRTGQIPCQPISLIESVDFEYAHDLKCTIRQISRQERRVERPAPVCSRTAGAGAAFLPVGARATEQKHGRDHRGIFGANGIFRLWRGRRSYGGGRRFRPLHHRSRRGRPADGPIRRHGSSGDGEWRIHRAALLAVRRQGSPGHYRGGEHRAVALRDQH